MDRERPFTPLTHLARLFELTPDLLATAGYDGYLKHFNDAWERELGWARPQLEAKPYLELVHDEDVESTKEAIARVARGERVYEHLCRMCRRSGDIRWFSWSGAPGGETFYIVGRDVTERVALEREVASVAAHDLSEPLRAVSGYLELLERRVGDDLDDDVQRLLDQALDGAQRMRRLLDDVLLYARVSNHTVERSPTDLGAIAGAVLRDLRAAIQEAGATVNVAALPTVAAEPTQMAQLLQNLVANAVKFRAPDRAPVVDVGAERDGSGWVLSVGDNGVGIPGRDPERVFTMFTRVHGRDVGGTGIGLAICRRIAERHGGRIWVESAPGGGSTFRVLLPDVVAQPT